MQPIFRKMQLYHPASKSYVHQEAPSLWMHKLLTAALLSVLSGLVMPDKCCVVYVNPLGVAAPTLQKLKEDILTAEEFEHLPDSVQFEETDCSYRDILAKARSRTEQLEMFFILDENSADRGAVLAVETRQYVGEKGIEFRYPSACSSRRFYVAPKEASIVACNIDLANIGWEDYAENLDRNGVFHA